MHRYFVYILANVGRTIYVGMTSNLPQRIQQHRNHTFPGFTAKHNISKLVYFEEYGDVRDAIAREKELKGWDRTSKVALIEGRNSRWEDLASDWI